MADQAAEVGQVDIALLGLPPSVREKLYIAGYTRVSDFAGIQPVDLSSGRFGLCVKLSPRVLGGF